MCVFLFDWDNTLVESWDTIHNAWNATLDDFSLPRATLAETKARVRLSAKESFPKVFGADSARAIALYRKHYQDAHTTPKPILHAETFLQFCQEQRIPCGVISNKSDDFLQQEIAELEWQSYFPLGSIGAGKASADKPNPIVLHTLLPEVADFSNYYYIGDTGVDIEFAHRCGMVSVLIGDNYAEGDCVPDKKSSDLSSLIFEIEDFSL